MKIGKGALGIVLLTLILVGCFSLPIGDGNKLKISTDGIAVTDSEGGEQGFTLEENDETLTMKSFSTGDEEVEVIFGDNLALPDDFPNDIPLADDANIHQTNIVESAITIAYTTKMSAEDIDKVYEAYFNSDHFVDQPHVMEQIADGYFFKHYQGVGEDRILAVQVNDMEDKEDDTVVVIVVTEIDDEY